MSSIGEDGLSLILKRLRLTAGVSTEATLCGASWAVDTSGSHLGTFHLVQSGDCWLHMDGAPPRRLHAGDLVLFPRDAGHLLTPDDEVPVGVAVNEPPPVRPGEPVTRMLCGYIEFRSRAAWPLLAGLPDAFVIDLAGSAIGDTRNLLQLLISEAFADQPGRSAVVDHLVHVMVVFALRQHIGSGASVGLLAALADPRMGRALSRFHAAPEKRWSVESLAVEAGMSRAAFASAFRNTVGETPMSYVTGWRMQTAIDLLTGTDDSVAYIAEAVGYESEAAFRHAFRKVVGTPPGQIRRSRQPVAVDR